VACKVEPLVFELMVPCVCLVIIVKPYRFI
jgi:hypothetical protein